MISENEIDRVIGSDVHSTGGDKIGKAGQVYLDDETGKPEWVTVHTGLFGTNESFIPLAQANLSGGGVQVPYDKDKVKNAPNVSADGHLSPQEEEELFRYYGVDYGGTSQRAGYVDTDRSERTDYQSDRETVGRDTSGPTTDDAMTRSEERLRVGKVSQEAGRVRLRKYITTEQQQVQVPVTREEVRVEREPITDANIGNATSGPELSEEEHEVVLHEERAVVEKDVVPVERVRLDKTQVTETQTVADEVRKEQIEVEGAQGTNVRDDDLRDDRRR